MNLLHRNRSFEFFTVGFFFLVVIVHAQEIPPYAVVDTMQDRCFELHQEIPTPSPTSRWHGQDAQHRGKTISYRENGDGTVSDLHTGLMWQQHPGSKMTYDQAVHTLNSFQLANYSDWRLPTIKELYSLIDFNGTDPSGYEGRDVQFLRPFINPRFFRFEYGSSDHGERIIDSQYASKTIYTGNTIPEENGKVFGVNFADGRIKGYGMKMRGRDKTFYVLHVRGSSVYGKNQYSDLGDGTIRDEATSLTWQKNDSGKGMNWADALAYARNLRLANRNDWRLPNAKELQSLVDYERSPDRTQSAAINPIFQVSSITNEAGQADFPWYWTSTTHISWNGHGNAAVYVTFGRALGFMNGRWMDVHGAGSQRSDPKTGRASDYPCGRGPQGDAIRILLHVRCVHD